MYKQWPGQTHCYTPRPPRSLSVIDNMTPLSPHLQGKAIVDALRNAQVSFEELESPQRNERQDTEWNDNVQFRSQAELRDTVVVLSHIVIHTGGTRCCKSQTTCLCRLLSRLFDFGNILLLNLLQVIMKILVVCVLTS